MKKKKARAKKKKNDESDFIKILKLLLLKRQHLKNEMTSHILGENNHIIHATVKGLVSRI